MSKKQKKFADDGWAIWVDGDDTSTVYINNWLNPKGKSYVDLAIRIRGVKSSKFLRVYVPFAISSDEIEDISLLFDNTKILQATFSAACIIDYKKNEHTSEIAYLPADYKCDDVITYQWNQNRENNQQGQFNFYYNLSKDSVSKSSMFFYVLLLFTIGIFGDLLAELVKALIRMCM